SHASDPRASYCSSSAGDSRDGGGGGGGGGGAREDPVAELPAQRHRVQGGPPVELAPNELTPAPLRPRANVRTGDGKSTGGYRAWQPAYELE
ncbi:hypothetical protein LTR28_008058, partial [Elasticomyces elasticus]